MFDASGAVAQTLMLSTNQVGSVQLVTDASTGEVVQRLEYDEFGRVFTDSAPGMQPFGFAGGLYDSATNLVRFGARDYSADVGRWVARDPVRFGQAGVNGYIYISGEPLNRCDPHGTWGVTEQEHCDRNKQNKCPKKEPNQCEDGGPEFDFDPGFPGGDKYRSSEGYECKYDEEGNLLPDASKNYSYNYAPGYSDSLGAFLDHLWKDVGPDYWWGDCYGGQTTSY